MIEILQITLRTLIYGNYGIFLIMGNAGFLSSKVLISKPLQRPRTLNPKPNSRVHLRRISRELHQLSDYAQASLQGAG